MKKTLTLLLALIMLFSLCACGKPEAPEASAPEMKELTDAVIPAFTININGTLLTDAALAGLPVYEISVHTVNSSGTESDVTYAGYSLPDVLAAVGITQCKTLSVTADDGYRLDLDGALAFEAGTLIAVLRDGSPFKSGPWFAPCSSGTTGDYLKNMASLSLDGADVTVKEAEETEPEDLSNALPEIADKTDKVQFAPYSFKLNGADVTNETLEGLPIYKISVTVTNSKGNTSDAAYTGYKLADVLAACGLESCTQLSAVASDGHTSELAAELIHSDYTLIAIEKDKETGENGTVWLAPCSETSSGAYAKLVVEIVAE